MLHSARSQPGGGLVELDLGGLALLRVLVLGQLGVGLRGQDVDVLELELQAGDVGEGDDGAVVLGGKSQHACLSRGTVDYEPS